MKRQFSAKVQRLAGKTDTCKAIVFNAGWGKGPQYAKRSSGARGCKDKGRDNLRHGNPSKGKRGLGQSTIPVTDPVGAIGDDRVLPSGAGGTMLACTASIVGTGLPAAKGWVTQSAYEFNGVLSHIAGKGECAVFRPISASSGAKGGTIYGQRHRRGEVALSDGLGQPTPTSSTVCDNTTLRSSGARGLDPCRAAIDISLLWSERHQHTMNSRRGIHRRGKVSSPSGLGQPDAYGFRCATIHVAPLGL